MTSIVDYGLGNLTSILNMLRYLGIEGVISSDPEVLRRSDRLILPGVGHFRQGMDNLRSTGLQELLNELVLVQKRPVLGICLGAQLMTMHSEEGDVDGLQWVDIQTRRFDSSRLAGLKVPHMGWTDITVRGSNPLWQNLPPEPRFYHVHSFHFVAGEDALVSATAVYGYEFVTAFRKDNIFGTQFHPEKSHKFGMAVLDNFARL